MADYFTFEPLLGGTDDLLMGGGSDHHWDADLLPEEYGDQSGYAGKSWDDDDHDSFTDSEDGFDSDLEEEENVDDENDGKHHHLVRRLQDQGNCCDEDEEGDWGLVYTSEETESDASTPSSTAVPPPQIPPPNPLAMGMRRDSSKVRFCEEPPQEHSYEHCSREEYSQLYYSVHELQKQIDDLRLETQASLEQQQQQQQATTTSNKKKATNAAPSSIPAGNSLVYNNHKVVCGENAAAAKATKVTAPARRCTWRTNNETE